MTSFASLAVRVRARAPAWLPLAAVLGVVLAAFHPLWLHGDSCMAAQASPGVTLRGPVGAADYGQLPLADGVAAYIDEPQAVLAAHQIASGHWPWWNPHNGLGVPLFGNWQSSLLSPLRALVLWFPRSTWAFDLTYVLRLVVAGLGACLLALRLGLHGAAAATAGVVFALTGYFLRFLSMHHLNGEVWLPWLWLAADRVALGRTRGAIFLLVFVGFATVVGGNPQPALMAALGTAAFALWRARAWGWRGAMLVAASALPAVMFSASYWLAGLEYVHESVHHHDVSFGQDGYTAAGALGFLIPRPYGDSGALAMVAPHFGMVPLVLALLGLGVGLGRGPFLWLVLVLGAGKLANLWGTGWLGALPGLSMMKIFKYGYPLPALALALLAGNGVAAAGTRAGWRAALLRAAPAAALLAVLGWAGARAAASSTTLHLASWWVLLAPVAMLALAVSVWVAARGAWRRWLLVALAAGELIAAFPARWLPRLDPFAQPEYLRRMHEREAASRTFAAGGLLVPNQNAVFGQDDIRLHDGVFPRRYGKFVRRFLNPNVRSWPVFTGEDLGERPPELLAIGLEQQRLLLRQQVAESAGPSVVVDLTASTPARYFDLVNVEYFLLPGLAKPWVDGWPKDRFQVVYADETAVVVRRKTALPRAFFPKRVERVADEDEAFARMAADDFAPGDVAFLEGEVGSAAEAVSGSAIVRARPAPGDLVVAAQASAAGWLVVSVYPYPGLRAEVDGQPVPLVPADGTLSAVEVPRGRHEIRLSYVPRTRTTGQILAGVGAVLLLVLALRARGRAIPVTVD
ncbi:MAG: YfhO family protein [Planctomycetota bacterium]